jgi:hypothetical protein
MQFSVLLACFTLWFEDVSRICSIKMGIGFCSVSDFCLKMFSHPLRRTRWLGRRKSVLCEVATCVCVRPIAIIMSMGKNVP